MKCMRLEYLCNFGAFHSTILQLQDAPLCLTHLMHSILQLLRCQNSKTFSMAKPKPQLISPNFRTKKMHKLHQLWILGSWAPLDSFCDSNENFQTPLAIHPKTIWDLTIITSFTQVLCQTHKSLCKCWSAQAYESFLWVSWLQVNKKSRLGDQIDSPKSMKNKLNIGSFHLKIFKPLLQVLS